MFGRGRDRKKRKNKREAAAEAAEGCSEFATDGAGDGVEAVAEGCLGCDLPLLIALTLLAGIPLLLWSI